VKLSWSRAARVGGVLFAFALAGCNDKAAATQPSVSERPEASPIEMFTWWTREGENDALGALVRAHNQTFPEDDVINATAELSGLARQTLGERMQRGDPPDTFQANAGQDLMRWVLPNGLDDRESRLQPLNSLFDDFDGWIKAFPPEIVREVSYQGKLYGVPSNLHRINELFYNQHLMKRFGFEEPRSLADLRAMGQALEGSGIPLFALGTREPWTLALFTLECVLLAEHGPEFYVDYFRGNLRADDPRMRQTLTQSLALLKYVNADHARLSWLQALQLVARGRALMTVMGDWARVSFNVHDQVLGRDFGEQAFPGTEDVVAFTSDAFALPSGAKNKLGAARLLRTLGSAPGQLAIAKARQALPARLDVEVPDADAELRERSRLVRGGRLVLAQSGLVPARFADDVNRALAEMVETGDVDRVLHTLRSRYALLH
jgi:glucose/mannose transport system substrate-binding protein